MNVLKGIGIGSPSSSATTTAVDPGAVRALAADGGAVRTVVIPEADHAL